MASWQQGRDLCLSLAQDSDLARSIFKYCKEYKNVQIQHRIRLFLDSKVIPTSNRVESECEQELLFGLVQPGVIGAFIGGNDIQQETNFVWAKGFQKRPSLHLHLHLNSFNFQVGQGLINRHGPLPGSQTYHPPSRQGISETTIQKTALSCNPVTWSPGIQQYNDL